MPRAPGSGRRSGGGGSPHPIGRLRGMAESEVPDRLPGDPADFQDPAYREAVVDLLGAIAYGEISAFERLAEDAKMAPDARATRWRWRRWPRPSSGTSRGCTSGSPSSAPTRSTRWRRSIAPIDEVPRATPRRPTGTRAWSRRTSATGSPRTSTARSRRTSTAETRDLVIASLEDAGQADFVVDRIRRAIAADPPLGGRLALWGRRLMGEALTQAQRVAAERDALSALLAGGIDRPGLDLAAHRPDVHPDHRAARRADGRARPRPAELVPCDVRP